MHQLTYALKQPADTYREGRYATQHNRRYMLMQMGEQLVAAGYKHLHAGELKRRHVTTLLAQWSAQALSLDTIRNRLAVVRWWAAKVEKVAILPKDNASYGLPRRQPVARTSKAREVPQEQLTQVRDRYVRMSLHLQRAFGLRREESIKIYPVQADQRALLDQAKALAKRGSLIPAHKSYVAQLHRYEHWTRQAGLSHLHGLRHAYAQDRFLELAGFPCPAMSGPSRTQLTSEQREADYDARVIISSELGHCREAITATYLGR